MKFDWVVSPRTLVHLSHPTRVYPIGRLKSSNKSDFDGERRTFDAVPTQPNLIAPWLELSGEELGASEPK